MTSRPPPEDLFRNLLGRMFWCNLTGDHRPGQFVIRPTPALPMRTWAAVVLTGAVSSTFAAFLYAVSRRAAVSIAIASVAIGFIVIICAGTSILQFNHHRAGPVLTLEIRTRSCLLTRFRQEPLTFSLLEVQVVSGGGRYYEIPNGRELIRDAAILVVGRDPATGAVARYQAVRDDTIFSPIMRLGRALADAAGVPFRHDPTPTPMMNLASDEAPRPAA